MRVAITGASGLIGRALDMRILLHDYSGHPFQVQLARELSRRGHAVTHSYCAAYTSGKGHLWAEPGESIEFDPIGVGVKIDKMSFGRRLLQELGLGIALVRQARRLRPEVVMAANVPIPTLMVFAAYALSAGVPWVLWHQDVQSVAIRQGIRAECSPGSRDTSSSHGMAPIPISFPPSPIPIVGVPPAAASSKRHCNGAVCASMHIPRMLWQ